MDKYILLRAEDAEKMQVELKAAIYFSSSDGKRHIHEALALIPTPIEVSEEAREFVNEFFGIRVNGYAIELPYGSLNEWLDKAAAMLAARDKEIERRVRAESGSCSGCVRNGEQDQWIACTECCRNAPDNFQAATTSK